MATFDGPNKLITLLDPGVTPTQSVPDIYSLWKEWVRLSDNAKYLPAFDLSVGGNDTNPPEKLDGYFFVRNDLGWRVKPFEASGVTTLAGNLFAFDTGTALYLPTTGTFTAFIIGSVSSKALAVETGVSGLTGGESAQLASIETVTLSLQKLMKNRMETNPTTGIMTIYDDDDVTPLLTGNIYEDVVASQIYRGRGMERRNRLT